VCPKPCLSWLLCDHYLAAGDPEITKRIWQVAMEAHVKPKKEVTASASAA
jgi:hypothetical protein